MLLLLKINPKPFIIILDELSVTCKPLPVPPKISRVVDGLVIPMPIPSDLIIALVSSPILNCKLPPVSAVSFVFPELLLVKIFFKPNIIPSDYGAKNTLKDSLISFFQKKNLFFQ